MGFVSEKEEENQSLSMGRNTQASLMGERPLLPVFAGTVGACVAAPLATAFYHAGTKIVPGAKKLACGDVFRA
ncbi:hypothetical protein NC651_000127 [Populus alba x Populus x berolinensis]|nr:hypothetical protein NC651_000127 [Populus alba x Populus x berolinensis]